MLIKIEWQLEPRFYRQIMRENSFKQKIKFGSMCCGKRQNDEPKYQIAMCSIRYLYTIYTDLKCFSHRATYYATSRIQNLLKIASFFKNKEKTVICSNSNNHGAAFHRHCPRIKYIKLFFIRFIIVLRFLFNYTIRSNYLTPTQIEKHLVFLFLSFDFLSIFMKMSGGARAISTGSKTIQWSNSVVYTSNQPIVKQTKQINQNPQYEPIHNFYIYFILLFWRCTYEYC